MKDFVVEMWYEKGVPVTMTLLVNGLPVARQVLSSTTLQTGKRAVRLDESMNAKFQRPPSETLCTNCKRYHYPERIGCFETDPCPDERCLVSGPHEGWLHEDQKTRWGEAVPFQHGRFQ